MKTPQEELEEYYKRETSFAINGLLRIIALIVMLIAAIVLGTPTP
jgi:ABC-type sulfate transport system permease subunit